MSDKRYDLPARRRVRQQFDYAESDCQLSVVIEKTDADGDPGRIRLQANGSNCNGSLECPLTMFRRTAEDVIGTVSQAPIVNVHIGEIPGKVPGSSEESEERTMTEEQKSGSKKGVIEQATGRTLDNIATGAKIGASGEAAKFAVSLVEEVIGRKIPNLTNSKELNEALRIQVAAMALKAIGPMLGGDKGDLLSNIGEKAEVYVGVKFGQQIAAVVAPKLDKLMEAAKSVG